MESKFPVNMHIYTLCPSLLQSFREFCWAASEELRWQIVLRSIFHFGQISKFQKGVTPRKKLNQNFLWICTSSWYVLHNYLVLRNSVERFQRSCADCLSSIFHFGQISKFKKGISPRKKIKSKFSVDMRIYMVFPW